MKKLIQLRTVLTNHNAFIKSHPDKLVLSVKNGHVTALAAEKLSLKYDYTLTIKVSDYDHAINDLMVPILSWMSIYQYDHLTHPELRKEAVTFEMNPVSETANDVTINLTLSQRVNASKVDDGFAYTDISDELPSDMRSDWTNQILASHTD